MKRRREHGECDTREGGRGCLVFGTKICTFRKRKWVIPVRVAGWADEHWCLVAVIIAFVGVLSAGPLVGLLGIER